MSEERLASAVEHLYETFASYTSNRDMDACSHCVTRNEVARLFAAPLRRVPESAFERYAFKAMTTWGDVRDFKHFLPRLLELASEGSGVGIFTVAEKTSYAEWETWPQNERDAVLAFGRAAWKRESSGWQASEWLEALLLWGESAEVLLSTWLSSPDSDDHAEFASWVNGLTWLSDAQLRAAVLSPSVSARLENLCLAAPSKELSDELARAFDTLAACPR